MRKYRITLNASQLMTVLKALELKGRIGIGQFNEIGYQLSGKMNFEPEIGETLTWLAHKFGVANKSAGSFGPESETGRCWDIFQVLRKKYADDRAGPNDTGDVWRYDPLFVSDVRQEPPLILLESEPSPSVQVFGVGVSGLSQTAQGSLVPLDSIPQSYAKTALASSRLLRKSHESLQKKSRDTPREKKSKKSLRVKARAGE